MEKFKVLRKGSTGANVRLLQKWLNFLGYEVQDRSGYLENSTDEAVRAVQKDKLNAKPTGIVSKATFSAIKELFEKARDKETEGGIELPFEEAEKEVSVIGKKTSVPEPVNEHPFFGRLTDQKTKTPITGCLVKAFDLGAGKEPLPLGYTFSNEQGLFALAFNIPQAGKTPKRRKLKLIVCSPNGDQIHEQEIAAGTNSTEVINITVELPEAAEAPSPTIDELSRELNLQIPEELCRFLSEKQINTLADIRHTGGLSQMKGLPLTPDHNVVKTLEAHASLSAVSNDITANDFMIKQGYSTVNAIKQAPRPRFVKTARPVIGDFKAARTKIIARAQTQLELQMVTGLATNVINGFKQDTIAGKIGLPKWLGRKCGCKNCESAVSPLAYLADLLEYAITHLENAGADIDLDFLADNFHQPFAKLPASCSDMDKRVRQVRICIEVLRSYLKAHPPDAARQNALSRDEAQYRLTSYTTILDKLGVSFEEIRLARTAGADSRTALANRLGISPGSVRPDHLDDLFLDPASGAITEARLESLFGLIDTTRDPLAAGPTPDLQTWKLEHLHNAWLQEDWPEDPFTAGTLPLIDPDIIAAGNFRKPQAGEAAFDLWQARRSCVDNMLIAFKADREANDFDFILRQVLGDPLPDVSTLYQHLNNGTDLENTIDTIQGFHLTKESFRRLMEIKAKDDDPSQNVEKEEWDDVYAILAQARKAAEYPNWITEEHIAGLKLGPKVFVSSLAEPALAKWLADQGQRQTWINTLKRRNGASIIDPDLTDAADLKNPSAGDPAFDLWQARRNWIAGRLNTLKTMRETAADELTGFTNIVECSLGTHMADVDSIESDQKSGIDIEPRLSQLTVSRAAFTYLQHIRKLIQEGAPVLGSEWEAVYSILVQVEKCRESADWQDEERAQNISLGTGFFRIPPPSPMQFPPLAPPPLPEWRTTFAERRDWQDRLKARIEQEENTIKSLSAAVSDAEAVVLAVLRDALIMAANAYGITLNDKARWLTDNLLIDSKVSGCQMTSRISEAINTLQGLLFSVRTRQLNDTYPNLELVADDFDEEWKWIGSYATWRSAMFAYLYPENILIPSLRHWQTSGFRKLVEESGRNQRLNPAQACKAVQKYTDYFRDVAKLRIEASCQTRTRLMEGDCPSHSSQGWRCLFYMFARGIHTQTVYWSAYDPENGTGYAQSFWSPVPGMEDVIDITGAAPYEMGTDERFIFLFGRRHGSGAQQLIFTKYDLEQRKWDDEPQELELPDEASSFTAVVKQNIYENQPPHLAIRTPNGAIYERRLNRDGTDWEDKDSGDDKSESEEWRPTLNYLLGRKYSQLCAMVEISRDEYYKIVSKPNGDIYYRLFGTYDDARWRYIANGEFRGAFSWPGKAYMYIFYGNGSQTYYKVIKRSSADIGTYNIKTIDQLEEWLSQQTGVSLSHLVTADESRFSGLTYLQFFAAKQEIDKLDDGPAKFVREAEYRLYGKAYIDYLAGKLDSDKDWIEWKRADEIIKRFNTPSYSLQQVLLRSFGWPQDADRADTPFLLRDDSDECSEEYTGPNGLEIIAPTSGLVESSKLKHYSYQNKSGALGLYRTNFSRAGDELVQKTPVRIAPLITGPLDISGHYSEQELQLRKNQIAAAFTENETGPTTNLEYIKEAYYFTPVYIALQLQRHGYYTEALDWFRTVYDYSMPRANRKIYYGLIKEGSLSNSYERAKDWLLDPLNPHSIAGVRINTYTRFTLLSIVRCFLEYADAEFTRDTAESVPRARTLYMTALELLESEDLKLNLGLCSDLAGSLDIEVGDPKWERVWDAIKGEMAIIKSPEQLQLTKNKIAAIWAEAGSIEERFTKIRAEITEAKTDQPIAKSMETVISQKSQYLAQSQAFVQSEPVFAQAIEETGQMAGQYYGNIVSMVTGVSMQALEKEETELVWMREPVKYSVKTAGSNGGSALRKDYLRVTSKNPVTNSYVATVAGYANSNPAAAVNAAVGWMLQYVPAPSFNFCIPVNPVIEALQLWAELNLFKIRTCRNIAGIERELDPYSAPTDTVSGLPVIDAGGPLNLPGTVSFIPTPYRYSIIVERAKQLVTLAQQVETAFLSALEKRDAEYYNLMKARQDISTTRAGIRLQDLRIKVAEGEVKLSELQKDRAQLQADHYKKLLDEGVSGLELASLGMLYISQSLYMQASLMSAIPNIIAGLANGAIIDYSGIYTGLAKYSEMGSQILSTLASYERREQDWEFQRTIAVQDVKIGAQQVKISEDRLRVVGQERYIATLQAEHAEQTAEFLATKFTNVELYDWMADTLEGVYGFFLQQATSMAKLAASQLAFERQELTPPFIQDDYWVVKEGALSGGFLEENQDRRGLTGSARLLQDIYRLDQFAFETDQRKHQLTKNISLAGSAPAEFQLFKQTGVMNFATPMELFDRDFPGDYLRLIKRVRLSIIALIPAIDSIKATLTATGNSRVTVGKDVFQTVNLNRGTEIVALSSPRDATGMFELQSQLSDKLNPFEGMGVDTQWQFSMPKAANRFDFNAIADVIITIEYTSFSSLAYRQQVIQQLNNKISAECPFSFRYQFPDQWYDLNNPDLTAAPMVVRFDTRKADFPPNIENLKISHVVLYFVRADGVELEIPVTHLRFSEKGSSGTVGGGAMSIDGVISTRRGNAGSWISMIGKSPYGIWELSLNNNLSDGRKVQELIKNEEITDILFVITYSGITPDWPE